MKAHISLMAIVMSMLGNTAWAQEQDSSPRDALSEERANTNSGGINDIIVTAQRREQSLQDVPIAVTAISGADVSTRGVTSMQDLDQLTPGLVSTTSAGIPQRYLRGVGSQTVALYEQPVATYVDGVYIASASGSLFSFNNIERVEVLRGPQGTLFGRNATGGVVQVITRKPTQSTELDLRASYGSYDTVEVAGYGSTGLSEGIAANVAVYYRDQGKGYGRNLFDNSRINYQNDFAMRGQLLIEPTDNLTLRYSGDYTRQETDVGLVRQVLPGSRNVLGLGPVGGVQDANNDFTGFGKNSQWGISQDALLDLGNISIRSITSYREFKYFGEYDTDVVPVDILNARRFENADTFQQEFLISGDTGPLDWTVGAFYFKLNSIQDPVATFGSNAAGNFDRFSTQSVSSYAAYAQGTYAITDSLNLTAGARYTVDRTTLNGQFITTAGFPGGAGMVIQSAVDRKMKSEKPTWRFSLDYQFTDNVLGYASVSRGFKSGSFNNGSLVQAPTRPEVLDAYEAGIKSDLFDQQLRFNLSVFTYRYNDIQLNSVSLPNVFLVNAASAKINGAEIETLIVPRVSEGRLQIGASLALLDAQYNDFPNAQFFLPNPFAVVPPGLTCAVASSASPGGNTSCTFDASGNRMIRSPEWTLNVNVDYSIPVSVGDLGFNFNYFHNDGFFWEASNRTRQAGFDVINSSISLKLDSPGVTLRAFGRNLLDEKYYSSVSESAVGDVATPQAPRTFGVAFEYSF